MHPTLPMAVFRQAPAGFGWMPGSTTGWTTLLPTTIAVRPDRGGPGPGPGGCDDRGRGRRARCLVLASSQLPVDAARRAVLARAGQQPTEFHVVVPRRRDLAATAIVALAVGGGVVVDPFPSVSADLEADATARRYLAALLGAVGGDVSAVTGSVGEANALGAISRALTGFGCDDILVVAPSNRFARALRIDLRSRAARRFRLPVHEAPAS